MAKQVLPVTSFDEWRKPNTPSFDPEGTGYDYDTATAAGGKPDASGHWGSLDPRTGMVLKGRQHDTWHLMLEEEERRGNTIAKRGNRYYSVKPTAPSFDSWRKQVSPTRPAKPVVGLLDVDKGPTVRPRTTPEQISQAAERIGKFEAGHRLPEQTRDVMMRPPERPGFLKRFGKGIMRKGIVEPLKAIETRSRAFGGAGVIIEMGKGFEEFRKVTGRKPTPEEVIQIQHLAVENLKRITDEKYSFFDVPPPETVGEKATEVATGLGAFVGKIAIAKKILGGHGLATNVAAWEAENIVSGGTPGTGAAIRLTLGAIGKIPGTSIYAKTGRFLGPSGALAGLVAVSGGTKEDIAVAALIPLALRAIDTSGRYALRVRASHQIKSMRMDAKTHGLDLKNVPDQTLRVIIDNAKTARWWQQQHKKGKVTTEVRDARVSEIKDRLTPIMSAIAKQQVVKAPPTKERAIMKKYGDEAERLKAQGGPTAKEDLLAMRARGMAELGQVAGKPPLVTPPPIPTGLARVAEGMELSKADITALKTRGLRDEAITAMTPERAREVLRTLVEAPPVGKPAPKGKITPKVVEKEAPVEEKVKAFHGTRADIETFRPLSHFGTERAAERALESVKGKGEPKVISAELTLKNPLEVTDVPHGEEVVWWSNDAVEKGAITEQEAATIEDILNESGVEKAETAFVKLLKSKGYDGLKYINKTEDVGSVSYVIFDPKQVKVAQPPVAEGAKEAVIPARPMVNPKATALEQDKQLRRQQVWDRKYGKIQYGTEALPKPLAEGAKRQRGEILQARLKRGESVPGKLLTEFESEKWAQEALGKKVAPKKVLPSVHRQVSQSLGAAKIGFETFDPAVQRAQKMAAKAGKDVFVVQSPITSKFATQLTKPAKGNYTIVRPDGTAEFIEQAKVLVTQRRGVLNVKPLLQAHKTFMAIIEPSKAVEMKVGKEPYAAVIKGIHQVDVGRLEFNQAKLTGHDKNLQKLGEWFDKFPDKDLKNLMLTRGQPMSVNAQLIQREALKALPKELRGPKVRNAIQQAADFNYQYLQKVVGDDINKVADYFYGIYKDRKMVGKFLDYWRTTKRFTKEKKLPTVADAVDYGLELRNYNPINNLRTEYIAIAHLDGMNWLKNELMRTGKGKFIDEVPIAPTDWDIIQDPVFTGLRIQPDLAKMINNLIATNKLTQVPLLNTIRQTNNFLRTLKFMGSAFHLLSVAKQSVADSGYLGFLYKPTALRGVTTGFRKDDPIFRTPFYKRYIGLGGGHHYAVESEARKAFTQAVNELNTNAGRIVKVGALPLRIPVSFVNWMFNSYIPKVKYSKTLDWYNARSKQLGRELSDAELIDIIKEGQNFYGMMNERLFGRSGTVTTGMRFYWFSPGYAEGNYRSMLKGAVQWGGKEGYNANRSRSNIINSWILTAAAATVGTLIMTGKPPKKPETLDDMRDLFKIDTGKLDNKDKRIMIDLMTYDKDYWNVAFNTLRLRPDKALSQSVKRIGGMKAPMADMFHDLAAMSLGKAVYDWKGDRVVEITDPFLQKALKLSIYEIKKIEPISVSVFKQSRRRGIDKIIAAVQTLAGYRPTYTEADTRE